MAERAYLSIGEVLDLLKEEFDDITISKIRFLESQGLIDPERTPSGYRKFYDGDVERLRWILQQQREHFLPLRVIKDRLESEGDRAYRGGAPAAEPVPSEPARAVPAEPVNGARPDAAVPTVDPLSPGLTSVSLTLEELADAARLQTRQVEELARFGLLAGRPVGGQVYYDEEALVVARLAASFMAFGVEARHLRMYRTNAEREASFFEQLVLPLVKQRNPAARRQAHERLGELARLGSGLRAAMLRQALKDHLRGG
jgi:DNA-binding transcriptional MerR regulator